MAPQQKSFLHTEFTYFALPQDPYLENIFQKYKTVSFNRRITLSPFYTLRNIQSRGRSLYDSLENSEQNGTPNPILPDKLRIPVDAALSSLLPFEIYKKYQKSQIFKYIFFN